jgi:F-type H+-transporting ATPase subunit a
MLSELVRQFAAVPVIHITSEPLFTIHGLIITNSILFAWVCSAVVIIMLAIVAKMMTLRPKGGLIQFIEIITDFIINLVEESLGDHAKAVYYAPYFVTIFFFIMFNNLFGLLPGVGEALTYHGEPLFRAFTADLNGTLAVAVVAMIMVQYFAIRETSVIRHLKHFFNGSYKNPITWILGIFEIFSELTRVLSLALRLFLNVAIGEIIIAVFAYLGHVVAPITALPFVFLELFVAILQAYIFVMLCIMYMSVAIHHEDSVEGIEHPEELEPRRKSRVGMKGNVN